eukprot:1158713-Pelagomonas_calceolata.AAC.7
MVCTRQVVMIMPEVLDSSHRHSKVPTRAPATKASSMSDGSKSRDSGISNSRRSHADENEPAQKKKASVSAIVARRAAEF